MDSTHKLFIAILAEIIILYNSFNETMAVIGLYQLRDYHQIHDMKGV